MKSRELAEFILKDPILKSVLEAMRRNDRFGEDLVLFLIKPAAKKLGKHFSAASRREAARILCGSSVRKNPEIINVGTFDALRKKMILVFGPTIRIVNELNHIGGNWRPDKNCWMFSNEKRRRIDRLVGKDDRFFIVDYDELTKNPKMEKIDRGGNANIFSDGKKVEIRMSSNDISRDLIINVRKTLGKSGFVLPNLKKLKDGTYSAPLYHVYHPIVDMIFDGRKRLDKDEFLGRLEFCGINSIPYKKALDLLEIESSGKFYKLDLSIRNIVVDDNRNVVMLDPVVVLDRNPKTMRDILTGARKLARDEKWDELEKYADENVEDFLKILEQKVLKKTGKKFTFDKLKDHSNAISCMVTGDKMTRHGITVDRNA